MLIPRTLKSALVAGKKSVLLLGPRQVGKSTLAKELEPKLYANLARESTYLEFARNPSELEERLAAIKGGTIFIDEIQRLPSLLNTIQAIIDEQPRQFRFILTGSSARKLKRGHANLLPGRIHAYHLGPLSIEELEYKISTEEALAFGTLPGIVTEESADDKKMTLKSYAGTYLREEIQAEALTKNIEGFSRLIFAAAASATTFLDFQKLASEASIPRQTAVRYFEILEDTFIVHRCESFAKSNYKRLVQHPRFFFFDVGVLNGLLDNFSVSSDRIGRLFEHLLYNQISTTLLNHGISHRLSSYRTQHGVEVDFILEADSGITAIEAKASKNVGTADLRGLKNFATYLGQPCRCILLTLGKQRKIIDDIEIIPWMEFVKELKPN